MPHLVEVQVGLSRRICLYVLRKGFPLQSYPELTPSILLDRVGSGCFCKDGVALVKGFSKGATRVLTCVLSLDQVAFFKQFVCCPCMVYVN